MKGLVFTYALTIGGSLVSLYRPFTGLLVYVAFGILKPDALWEWSVTPGNYSRIVFISLLIGWAFQRFGDWKLGRARFASVSLLIFGCWTAISATAASNQDLAWTAVENTVKLVLPILVGVTLIETRRQLWQLAWVIVLSQGFLAFEFNTSYYEGFNRLVTIGFAGMDDKSVAISMVAGSAVAVFVAMASRRSWLKALAFVLGILMVHVPLFTFSRGGMMALLATAAAVFLLVPKRPFHLAVVVVVVLLGFRLAGAEVRQRFSTSFAEGSERDASAQSRVDLWSQAWETMLERPVLGVGPRHWGYWSQVRFGWPTPKEAHNTWLQIGAELGFVGGIALLWFFVGLSARLMKPALARLRTETADDRYLAGMVVTGLIGFLVASQFITVYGLETPYYIALLGAGLLKIRSAEERLVASSPDPGQTVLPASARLVSG